MRIKKRKKNYRSFVAFRPIAEEIIPKKKILKKKK